MKKKYSIIKPFLRVEERKYLLLGVCVCVFVSFPFFLRKKSLDLKKFENHVVTFLYWFWFGSNFQNT
jgi:hypothetical protein